MDERKAKAQANDRRQAARRNQERNALMDELKGGPCDDCGRRFPTCAMDFDHRSGKTAAIRDLLRSIGRPRNNLEKIMAEVAKCDLVCANCHRVRTKLRALLRRSGCRI